MSARWFSPSVKLCFPSAASWLCLSTNCMFFSHTVLLKSSSGWKTATNCVIPQLIRSSYMCTVPPDSHKLCDVWFSTPPTLDLNQMMSDWWRAEPQVTEHTTCASCKDRQIQPLLVFSLPVISDNWFVVLFSALNFIFSPFRFLCVLKYTADWAIHIHFILHTRLWGQPIYQKMIWIFLGPCTWFKEKHLHRHDRIYK